MTIYINGEEIGEPVTATYVVAASNSINKHKADYVCDGTDDQVQIQQAIDALPAGGGHVLLLEGTFYLKAPVAAADYQSYIKLSGQGSGTVLDIHASFVGSNALYTKYCNYLTLTDFLINGHDVAGVTGIYTYASASSSTQGRVTIERVNTIDMGSLGLWVRGGTKAYVHNCSALGSGSHGIHVSLSKHAEVCDCYVYDCGGNGIRLAESQSLFAIGNYVENCLATRGILLCSGLYHRAIGNTLVNNQLALGGHYALSQYASVIDNIFIGDGSSNGLQAVGTRTSNGYLNSDFIIEGNIFYNQLKGAAIYPEMGVSADNVIRRVTLRNNKFVTCTTGVDVDLATKVFDTVIIGNEFYDCTTPISDNGTNTKYFDGAFDFFMDILAASANAVHAAITGTGAEQEITTAITNPDVPRNISITNSANSTGDVVITGVDAKGVAVTDTITIVTGGIAYGVVAFSTVSKITIPATVANPDTIEVGISDKLGLSNVIYASSDVYKVKVNNADDPTIGTVNTTYDTVDCATINAADDITIWYKNNLNIIV